MKMPYVHGLGKPKPPLGAQQIRQKCRLAFARSNPEWKIRLANRSYEKAVPVQVMLP